MYLRNFIEPELFVSGRSYWLYVAALPAVVAYVILTSFLHGASRFPALSAVAVAQGSAGSLSSGALYAAGELECLLGARRVGGLIPVGGRAGTEPDRLQQDRPSAVFRPDLESLRDQIRYGAQGQIANLAQLFNYRLDQFLVAAFVSRAGVGHYTVAVGLGESVWWLSSSVALWCSCRA